jgi:adenylate cyclase
MADVFVVWAERYDRDLNDIFALQDEIPQAIVKALKLKLMPEEKKAIERRGTDNVEAYNLFLMAWQYYVTGLEGDVRRAESIIRLCAGAAMGYGMVALAIRGETEHAREWIKRALLIDPDNMNMRYNFACGLSTYARD